jgi:hypothetical protein
MADQIQWSEIVKRAHTDPEFKKALLSNPREAIEKATGITLPEGVEFNIHEQSPAQVHLVLPLDPATNVLSGVFYNEGTDEDGGETTES